MTNSNFNKTLSVADIIRFTREDKYKFLFAEYVMCTIYGFNLCIKVDQTAVINIVKDMTDFTVEGWKIGKEIPTWVLGYDEWVNSLTAMVPYMAPLFFFELRASLITFRIFVR